MGRGEGGADELLYGSDLSSHTEKVQMRVKPLPLDEAAIDLAQMLMSQKRDPVTLEPDDEGAYLLRKDKAFYIYKANVPKEEGGISLALALILDEDRPLVALHFLPGTGRAARDMKGVGRGESTARIIEGAQAWAMDWGGEQYFPASAEDIEKMINDLRDQATTG